MSYVFYLFVSGIVQNVIKRFSQKIDGKVAHGLLKNPLSYLINCIHYSPSGIDKYNETNTGK